MKLLVVTMLMALVLAGCGSGDAGEETELTVPDGTDGGVILAITDEGGFVPVEFNLQRVPRFTVFADGTVVAPEGEQFTFPGPAIPRLKAFRVDESTLADIVAFVRDLGLADIASEDINNAPNVADASTTVVRYFDDGGEHRLSIYALGFESGDAREAIVSSMISALQTADESSTGTEWTADRLVVYASGTDGLDPQQLTNAGRWPLTLSPAAMPARVAAFSCVTLQGADATSAYEAIVGADSMTTWTFDSTEWRIIAKPLLPHEDGC